MAATTVREAKAKLAALLERLEKYDETSELKVELSDNCGGSYMSDILDFSITTGFDGNAWLTNY